MYEEAGDDSDDPQCGEHAEPRDEEVPGRAEGVHVRGLGGRLGPSLSAQGDHDHRQAREQLPRGRGVASPGPSVCAPRTVSPTAVSVGFVLRGAAPAVVR